MSQHNSPCTEMPPWGLTGELVTDTLLELRQDPSSVFVLVSPPLLEVALGTADPTSIFSWWLYSGCSPRSHHLSNGVAAY